MVLGSCAPERCEVLGCVPLRERRLELQMRPPTIKLALLGTHPGQAELVHSSHLRLHVVDAVGDHETMTQVQLKDIDTCKHSQVNLGATAPKCEAAARGHALT